MKTRSLCSSRRSIQSPFARNVNRYHKYYPCCKNCGRCLLSDVFGCVLPSVLQASIMTIARSKKGGDRGNPATHQCPNRNQKDRKQFITHASISEKWTRQHVAALLHYHIYQPRVVTSCEGPEMLHALLVLTDELVPNASFSLCEAACGRRLWSLGIDVLSGHRCQARRSVVKHQARGVRRVPWEA